MAALKTLPDYLQPDLDLVFVGINPGLYSAQVGHYFANLRNRFWAAFNAAGMTPTPLAPETDSLALRYGIGFTDTVKRPTRGMSELKPAEFKEGAVALLEKLLSFRPRVVCFNGVSGYRNFARHAEGWTGKVEVGLQPNGIGRSMVFVLPSTSPANAGVSLERIVEGMRELKALVDRMREGNGEDQVVYRHRAG